jgi:hypothetical protein
VLSYLVSIDYEVDIAHWFTNAVWRDEGTPIKYTALSKMADDEPLYI